MKKKTWYLVMSLILVANIAAIIFATVILLYATLKVAVMLATISLVVELALLVVVSVGMLTQQRLMWMKLKFEEED